MNIRKKPFAIYMHNHHFGREGYWERVSSYRTMDDAFTALMQLSRTPKKDRVFVYVILPNHGETRWILIKDHEQLLKMAR